MKALFEAMRKDANFMSASKDFSEKGTHFVYGCMGAARHALCALGWRENPVPMVIITTDDESASAWRDDLDFLLPGTEIFELPSVDMLKFEAEARSLSRMARRMDALWHLLAHDPAIVIASPSSAAQKDLSRRTFKKKSFRLASGDTASRDSIIERLAGLGYSREADVSCAGEYSVRGGIIDVFPINAALPVRIEFFGDEIDSLREFSPETKRSLANISKISILPLSCDENIEKRENFLKFLEGKGIVFFDEPIRIREEISKIFSEDPEERKNFFNWKEILGFASENNMFFSSMLLRNIEDFEPQDVINAESRDAVRYNRQTALFASDAEDWLKTGRKLLVLAGDSQKSGAIRDMLSEYDIPSYVMPNPAELSRDSVTIAEGTLSEGFEIPGASLVLLTEKDIFGRQKKKIQPPKSSPETRIASFREIKAGDYVVHVNHGIGKYLGVETLDVGGTKRDYLHIKYGGDDKLFIPTDQVGMIQKFIGAEGTAPHLSRMGSSDWAKAKARAKASTESIAKDLIALYAKRRETPGFAFPPDTPWQREFEDAFPYEETPDQLTALREIKADMEKPVPMDRLLCGDVGFGKTEVAVRAAFKAVMGGKQVAVLVPTTVLAQQHFKTLSERFHNFGPEVDVICRFRTMKEQRNTLSRVESGRCDILIGTHALLNHRRVKFRDLGLLIVDEEQRFGVKQKERIKEIAAGVDVLTLSATPIPRTLHMSLVGARDMSVIETPPEERYPVETYVAEAGEDVIAAAIRREMKRGGQTYFVYNRVETIDRMRDRIKDIVPEAKIQTAHGQMPEELLEQVMMDFYDGRYDVLLATSIVENGLDVPTANTIIIYDADHFGLSQLYQMRGRVGRSHQMAFAYFVYKKDKILSETAEKRLHAMKEFAELGAGFRIAMRDLELRGAGNLLGREQHGHIADVGFEMYCRMLDEAVAAQREKMSDVAQVEKPKSPHSEPVVDIPVDAYIDGGYISDAMHKIEIYHRISAIRNEQHIVDLTNELIDRFGEPSEPATALLGVARIKNFARDLGVKSIVEKSGVIDLILFPDHSIKPGNFAKMKSKFKLQILPAQNIMRFRLPAKTKPIDFLTKILAGLSGNCSGE